MKNNVIIYDPPMCCSSGVCGPDPDQQLIELDDAIGKIRAEGTPVERYIITQSPEKFKENPAILQLIQEQQLKVLPITTYGGEVVKTGGYPTLAEMKSYIKGKN